MQKKNCIYLSKKFVCLYQEAYADTITDAVAFICMGI